PDVTGCHPHLLGQDDTRVQPDDVVAARDHVPPPLPLDVLLQLDAEGSVVPRGSRSAVDLARLEDEPPMLCEGDDGVETAGCGHGGSNGPEMGGRPGTTTRPSYVGLRGPTGGQSPAPGSGYRSHGRPTATLWASRPGAEGATVWNLL